MIKFLIQISMGTMLHPALTGAHLECDAQGRWHRVCSRLGVHVQERVDHESGDDEALPFAVIPAGKGDSDGLLGVGIENGPT